MRETTQVIVSARGGGKTHKMIQWLIDGHKKEGWPGWSRIMVVGNRETCRSIITEFEELQHELWSKESGGLGKLVVTVQELKILGRFDIHDLEIGVDDADQMLAQHLGLKPDLITINGELSQ